MIGRKPIPAPPTGPVSLRFIVGRCPVPVPRDSLDAEARVGPCHKSSLSGKPVAGCYCYYRGAADLPPYHALSYGLVLCGCARPVGYLLICCEEEDGASRLASSMPRLGYSSPRRKLFFTICRR